MDDMLASIRQAIHRESAHQVTGLHARHAPANDVTTPSRAPGYSRDEDTLRPLTRDDPDTDWSTPLHPRDEAPGDPTPENSRSAGAAPAPGKPRKAIRRVIGGVMSGQVDIDEALERLGQHPAPAAQAPAGMAFEDHAFDDATMSGPADGGGSWWPDSDEYSQVPEAASEPEDTPLLSPESASAAADAFSRLKQEIGGAGRLEEMTRQMLRPMLREWLDENLPPLVEQLVREEIQRISRGGLKD
jgi:cell pole-organizing protein PopZ